MHTLARRKITVIAVETRTGFYAISFYPACPRSSMLARGELVEPVERAKEDVIVKIIERRPSPALLPGACPGDSTRGWPDSVLISR